MGRSVDSGWGPAGTPPSTVQFDGSYGTCYVSSAVETVISAGGTAVKALGTTTAGELRGFSHANNKLTYLSTQTKVFQVDIDAIVICAGDGKTLSITFAKDGAENVPARTELALATGAVPTSISCTGIVELDEGEYVEVFVGNETDTDNLTVNLMQLVVTEVG